MNIKTCLISAGFVVAGSIIVSKAIAYVASYKEIARLQEYLESKEIKLDES